MTTPITRSDLEGLLGTGAQLVEVLPEAEYLEEHLPGRASTRGAPCPALNGVGSTATTKVESPPHRPGSTFVSDESAFKRRWPAARVAPWTIIGVLVVVSEVTSWAGHAGASYGVDGLALLAFLGFRRLRRSPVRRS
jgi:hypothetical protein